jgi:hypothetical protein
VIEQAIELTETDGGPTDRRQLRFSNRDAECMKPLFW